MNNLATMEFPEGDTDFEDSTLEEITEHGDWFEIRSSKGWGLGIGAEHAEAFKANMPLAGQQLRTYGCLGFPVRGLFIDGRRVWYRTKDEEAEQHRAWVAAQQRRRVEEFEREGRAKQDAQYDAVPDVFKRRIDKFRRNNPEFRVEFEAYELFCCTEALKIADALKTSEAVQAWTALSYDERKAAVPDLDYAAHSGNTFDASGFLASLYLHDALQVEHSHGALAPLVGCEKYGCHPKPPASTASEEGGVFLSQRFGAPTDAEGAE